MNDGSCFLDDSSPLCMTFLLLWEVWLGWDQTISYISADPRLVWHNSRQLWGTLHFPLPGQRADVAQGSGRSTDHRPPGLPRVGLPGVRWMFYSLLQFLLRILILWIMEMSCHLLLLGNSKIKLCAHFHYEMVGPMVHFRGTFVKRMHFVKWRPGSFRKWLPWPHLWGIEITILNRTSSK